MISRSNENFFALMTMLQSGARSRARSPAHAAAKGIVRLEILPIIRVAFEIHQGKDASEILALCEPALIEVVRRVIEK